MSTSTSSGLRGMAPNSSPFDATGLRGGPPIICSSICTGSGTFTGAPPGGRRRPAPLGIRTPAGKLVLEELGETSDKDDDRGLMPGRGGNGMGPAGYGRRGAGE
jgi:hypothetical protein